MTSSFKSKVDDYVRQFQEGRWVSVVVIAVGGLLTIWLLGKSSRIIGQAIHEFKFLRNAYRA